MPSRHRQCGGARQHDQRKSGGNQSSPWLSDVSSTLPSTTASHNHTRRCCLHQLAEGARLDELCDEEALVPVGGLKALHHAQLLVGERGRAPRRPDARLRRHEREAG